MVWLSCSRGVYRGHIFLAHGDNYLPHREGKQTPIISEEGFSNDNFSYLQKKDFKGIDQ
jgi:hypothetical protein